MFRPTGGDRDDSQDEGRDERIEALRVLFKKTRALPQAQVMSEVMIAEEIEEYRAGR